MELVTSDQIRVSFKDGSSIVAEVTAIDGDNITASALSANEKYKQGDRVFLNQSDDQIEKLSKKQAKRFLWSFDKHKPQYSYNPETNVIEKEEDNVKKVGMKKQASVNEKICPECGVEMFEEDILDGYSCPDCGYNTEGSPSDSEDYSNEESVVLPYWKFTDRTDLLYKDGEWLSKSKDGMISKENQNDVSELFEEHNVKNAIQNQGTWVKLSMKKQAYHKQDVNLWVTKTWDDWKYDTQCNEILQSDLNDDEKKQKLIERITSVFNDNTLYGALFSDNNKEIDKQDITHNNESDEPVQIDEQEIDRVIMEFNEDKAQWTEDDEMFETQSKKAMNYGPKQALQDADKYYQVTLQGKIIPDGDDILDTAADLMANELGIRYEDAYNQIQEYQGSDMLDDGLEFDDYDWDTRDQEVDNEPWTDPAGGHHEGREPNLKQYEMKKESHKLSPETPKEVNNTFNDVKRLMAEYDQTDDYNKLLEIKGILTSLLRVVEAEAKECMSDKGKTVKSWNKSDYASGKMPGDINDRDDGNTDEGYCSNCGADLNNNKCPDCGNIEDEE